MGGNRQHSALKQAIYGSPGLYRQLLQWAMNQQHTPAPAGPRAATLCSVNIQQDSGKVHKGDKAMKTIGMTHPIKSHMESVTTILTSPTNAAVNPGTNPDLAGSGGSVLTHHSGLSAEHCHCRTKRRCLPLRQMDHFLELAQI